MKNLIFDLDGTLLNTLEDIANACNITLAKYLLPTHPVSAYRMMVGNGFDKLIRRALGSDTSLNDDEISAITIDAKNYYSAHLMEKTRPYPGICECLKNLVENGKAIAVLSNKPDPMTKAIISHFFPNLPFAIVQGAMPELPLKPSPVPLLNILQNFSWKPAECIYIGDSEVDVITGKNAHLKVAAVSWGFRDKSVLEREKPDFLCATPEELLYAIL